MKKITMILMAMIILVGISKNLYSQPTDMFIRVETNPPGADIYALDPESKELGLKGYNSIEVSKSSEIKEGIVLGKTPLDLKVLRFGKDPVTGGISAMQAFQMNIFDRVKTEGLRVRFFFRTKKDGFIDGIFFVDLYPEKYTQPVTKQISLVPKKSSLQQPQQHKAEKKYNSWMDLFLDIEKKVLSSSEEVLNFDELASISLVCCVKAVNSKLNISEDDERKACQILGQAIELDKLMWKPLFYLSLEKEKYDEAELVRQNWRDMLVSFSKSPAFIKYSGELTLPRVKLQIKKLDIVGLTDPMLINLRKEMVSSISNKKWDDAQKIQTIIASRVEELRPKEIPQIQEPPQPKVIEKVVERPVESAPSVTVQPPPQIIVQQPSEQHIQVENIPRYNAVDVGRAISLMKGRGGRLTGKEAGALEMYNILTGR